MGEAKRRKLGGTYPNPDGPIETARKFWAGKGQTRVEDFRVPEGTIAITFDIQGVSPSSVIIDPAAYEQILPQVESLTRANSYYATVQMVAKEFKRARLAGDDRSISALPWLALWTAYHHPTLGQSMRERVSGALRKGGKAHLSWQFGDNGLAIALAGQFVDLEPLAAVAPKDRVTSAFRASEPEAPMH